MFESVLIANRGEIACRIARTLRRLGVRSIAIYSEADRHSRHVLDCDQALCVGPAPAKQSYLNGVAVLDAARASGAQALHPGYGFLSENADFAEAAEARGVTFIGPTAEQMRKFGLKHSARALARAAGVPLLPGSDLLESSEQALDEARRIGFPVMLKSSAGGGGIGMQVCRDDAELLAAFESVRRLSRNNFGDESVFVERFVERARHIEVQIFGDGRGEVLALGERDCSAQRRNQKVIEETPAPNLDDGVRRALSEAAVALGRSVQYRSAGTIEFVYDAARADFYFLEVNTRLQVEHPVTEAVLGLDLVEWMVRTAAGDPPDLSTPLTARGHAIEVRVYAEDPARDFKPSAGLITEALFSREARVDTWIETGSEVPAFYDPMLAKIIVHGSDRSDALAKLRLALDETRIGGIETNLAYLRQLSVEPIFVSGETTTQSLRSIRSVGHSLEVLTPGTFSLVVDYPGRLGFWDVGIPPSGPMDSLSHRLANRVVGNAERAAALELTMSGPTLRFASDACVALTGARAALTLDGEPCPYFEPIGVRAGQILQIGAIEGPGCRAYLAVRGGFDVPDYLGSKTTFTLGGFGGHSGRTLRRGDVLNIGSASEQAPASIPDALLPPLGSRWEIAVLYGPHGAPDFFTQRDIDQLFATDFQVHYNSNRTGVRLIGPKPEWARADGGEAGLHPSNIHDVAYAIGAIDYTGDMPILLGPDGPSLGGFVCPATVVQAELWKIGQLRPGDQLRFVPIAADRARALAEAQTRSIAGLSAQVAAVTLIAERPLSAKLRELPATEERVAVVYRRAGDAYLLIEYGPLVLDLRLRFRVHTLMAWLRDSELPGIIDLTPGIRSLQVHYDPAALSYERLLDALVNAEDELPGIDDVEVPTRIVHLPLSWDDPATRLAISKYVQSVRPDAPWCPSNIEFIRRINGLPSVDDVYKTVFDASYLVLGLGDVYLGAPVATPIDPRHRLVTTKYNPARTWTPENAVGIGGAYLCVYGMEGPGGYQFVGRTLQVYNRFHKTREFASGTPWLLRFFDQIRFYPVSAEALLEMREAFPHGKVELRIDEGTFRLREHERFLAENIVDIAQFKTKQQSAFEAERKRWIDSGQLTYSPQTDAAADAPSEEHSLPEGSHGVESHVPGSVWKLSVAPGTRVRRGDVLLVVESMKMEIAVEASHDGTLVEFLVSEGKAVAPGQRVAILRTEVG